MKFKAALYLFLIKSTCAFSSGINCEIYKNFSYEDQLIFSSAEDFLIVQSYATGNFDKFMEAKESEIATKIFQLQNIVDAKECFSNEDVINASKRIALFFVLQKKFPIKSWKKNIDLMNILRKNADENSEYVKTLMDQKWGDNNGK